MSDQPLEPGILSFSSEVVHGAVGNKAARIPLEAMGFRFMSLPTVLLSNHAGRPMSVGHVMSANEIRALAEGLREDHAFNNLVAVMTGYFVDAEQIEAAGDIIADLKRQNPDLIYCCDPVLGDTQKGIYVKEGVPNAVEKHLLPLADLITPNVFELGFLVGHEITTLASAQDALLSLCPKGGLVSSIPDTPLKLATLASDGDKTFAIETAALAGAPSGTGDLLTALYLGHRLKGLAVDTALAKSVSAVYEECARSIAAAAPDLLLTGRRTNLLAPPMQEVVEV